MAYRIEKETGDIVVNGFEHGIAVSPHKGLGNIQNGNISTEPGEVMPSFIRTQDTMTSTATGTGSLTFRDSSHVNLSITNSNNLFKGSWISVTNSSHTGELPNGTYYVSPSTGAGFQLQNYYNVSATIASASSVVNILAVGGGGGGGGGAANNFAGGGGGSGQFNYQTAQSVTNLAAYSVTVGSGGAAGGAQANGTAGASSAITGTGVSITALGGGYGAAQNGTVGGAGASGGGGVGTGVGGAATAGNAGGTGSGATAGAGGGAGAVGQAGGNNSGNFSQGGVGLSNSITGAAVFYSGGGGGGGNGNGTGGGSSSGGGGAAGASTGGGGATNGSAGTANTGGGGGGGGIATSGGNTSGGAGGSGVVIISVPTGIVASATGGVKTTSGGRDIWTFTLSGTWTPTFATIAAPTNLLTGFTTGLTATIQLVATMGKPLASATETYYSSGTLYYRYYILDSQGLVWIYDTQNEVTYTASDNVNWFLPDYNVLTNASGIGVISGILVVATSTGIFGKSIGTIGNTNSQTTNFIAFPDANRWQGSSQSTSAIHFCYVGHQGRLYITDASYVTSIFPDSTIANTASTADNVQSFCSYTTPNSPTQFSINIISGTTPTTSDSKRLPALFFSTGTLPPTLTAGTVYYIDSLGDNVNYQVYVAATGGSALDIQSGSVGTQYFTTFYPLASGSDSASGTPTYVYEPQRLSLPKFEVAQCMAEIGNIVLIGCASNIIYPWDQVQNLPASIISLPEANTQTIITVHQMAYVFPGNKGNVYITDGNVASAVTTVPDYCAGVPGTPLSYIEPMFSWGAAMYLRGRVYFSILDQTAIKTGNCGGVWSFVPTQNLYIGQDIGLALRLENQNSYGTYNGVATVLIPKQNQSAIAPQYFSGWESSITSPAYGIDTTGTSPATTVIFETDGIPTGTMLDKKTFEQIELKFASPLLSGDVVSLNYRKDLTSAWKSCGTIKLENNKRRLSGYFPANFENTQWLQLQGLLTPGSASSFIRVPELRIR